MERFQNKKPNKEDHKKVNQAAKNVKKGAGVLGVALFAGKMVKDHGKDVINFAKNTIFKL